MLLLLNNFIIFAPRFIETRKIDHAENEAIIVAW